jgi:hypothetical protein
VRAKSSAMKWQIVAQRRAYPNRFRAEN